MLEYTKPVSQAQLKLCDPILYPEQSIIQASVPQISENITNTIYFWHH